jgi:hypothetical protein
MQKNTPTSSDAPKLLDILREKVRVKHYTIRTKNNSFK